MTDLKELIITDDGPIRHIRFNRPEKLNALNTTMHEGVLEELRRAEAEEGVRVIAFSGEGRSFCAGQDIGGGSNAVPERYRERMVALDIGFGPLMIQDVTTAIRNVLKPTVALMHGHALGAGYDYATSCDFRLASEDCRFGDPRVHRALWAAEGWSYKITRLIPQGWTTRMSLRGEPLTGLEAEAAGLVHKTYPAGENLREAAREYLLKLAEIPPGSYAVIKKSILDSLDLSYEAALAHVPRV
ncbi:MAG: enoyl-CoA hydratase/isomerase family protein [Deltaproteobacteria bacterium]|nr:enoyl-CoA hydratase/isomerase family protein [Deltaproteobacteria bacterium]